MRREKTTKDEKTKSLKNSLFELPLELSPERKSQNISSFIFFVVSFIMFNCWALKKLEFN